MSASVGQTLKDAESSLSASDSPRLDAEILLSYCLNKSREFLIAFPETELTQGEQDTFGQYLARRAAGEPVAYITGKKAFWDIELAVNPSVLVPRPETELLVESALELLADRESPKIADLGTGSGAIALAIAHSRPDWQLVAVDVSEAALETAQANANSLGVSNVEFVQSSWCDDLDADVFDCVIANPPYVAPGDVHLAQGDLRFEPNLALEAAAGGLSDLYGIASQARQVLRTGGYLLMEHGFDQHAALSAKMRDLGYESVTGHKDLSGQWRMIQGQWLGPR